jgi:hypothetical protein
MLGAQFGWGTVLLCFQDPFGGRRESSENQFCFRIIPCLGKVYVQLLEDVRFFSCSFLILKLILA